MLTIKRLRYISIALLVFILGCSAGRVVKGSRVEQPKPSKEAPEVEPVSKEKELGREFLKTARREYRFVTDHEVISLVNQVGRDIVEAMGGDPTRYHFLVVKNKGVNAFALPGGYIFIFDGLLKTVESIDALAGVLAHEVAHVRLNHFFENTERINAMNLATVAAIILSGLAGGDTSATATVAQAVNITFQLRFSRENEEEADLYAIRALKKTRYDPRGLKDFFETLLFYERLSPAEEIPPYLSTHPGLEERLRRAEVFSEAFSTQRDKVGLESYDWERIATILKAEAREEVGASLKYMGKKEGLSEERRHYLEGLSALKRGDYKRAISEYKEAIRLNPDNPIYHADLALSYIRLEEIALAKEEAERSLKLSRSYPYPYLALGMVALSQSQYEKGLELLKEALALAPYDHSIHYWLAYTYHLLKMPAKEGFHLGRYYRLKIEPERALYQFQKALSFVDEGDVFYQRIKDEIREIQREGL